MAVRERRAFTIGEQAEQTRTISEADLVAFAEVSGDTNPVHLNEEYARESFFKGRIAHGMLGASMISALLGTRLPGPGGIYLSQDLQFKAPMRPGDTVTTRVTVVAWDGERGRIALRTEVLDPGGATVITGEARLVMSSFLKARA